MASFCHFWRITPEQFWDLDLDDYRAMSRYMNRYAEEQDRAVKQARSRRR